MAKKKDPVEEAVETAKQLSLSEEQLKVANMLIVQGAKLEREALINNLSKYAGQAVSVDELINALKKVN